MLNYSVLKNTLPNVIYNNLLDVLVKFNINTPLRFAHFISQCAYESSNFSKVEENLNYSKDNLLKVFPKYFTVEVAEEYAKKPQLIANKIYANRLGNGSEESNDGWNYRGRGYIQLTGKANYKDFDYTCYDDILSRPELVSTIYPLESAAWFWSTRNLNRLADQGIGVETITKITKNINGGIHGLSNRVILFNKYWELIKNE